MSRTVLFLLPRLLLQCILTTGLFLLLSSTMLHAQSRHRPLSDGVAYELNFDLNQCLEDDGTIKDFDPADFSHIGLSYHTGHPNSFRRRSWADINNGLPQPNIGFVRAELVPVLVSGTVRWPLGRAPGFQSYLPLCELTDIRDLPPAHYPTVIFSPVVPDENQINASEMLLAALQEAPPDQSHFADVAIDQISVLSIAGVISAGWDNHFGYGFAPNINFPTRVSFDDPEDPDLRVSAVGSVFLPESTFIVPDPGRRQAVIPSASDVDLGDQASPAVKLVDGTAVERPVSDAPGSSDAIRVGPMVPQWQIRVVLPDGLAGIVDPSKLSIERADCNPASILDGGQTVSVECNRPPPYRIRLGAFRSDQQYQHTTIVLSARSLSVAAFATTDREGSADTINDSQAIQLPPVKLSQLADEPIAVFTSPSHRGIDACSVEIGVLDLLNSGPEIAVAPKCETSLLPWPASAYTSLLNCLNAPAGIEQSCIHRSGTVPRSYYPGGIANTEFSVPTTEAFFPRSAIEAAPNIRIPSPITTDISNVRYCFISKESEDCCETLPNSLVAKSVRETQILPPFFRAGVCADANLPSLVELVTHPKNTNKQYRYRWSPDMTTVTEVPASTSDPLSIARIRESGKNGTLSILPSGSQISFYQSSSCDIEEHAVAIGLITQPTQGVIELETPINLPLSIKIPHPFEPNRSRCFEVIADGNDTTALGLISLDTERKSQRPFIIVLSLPGADTSPTLRRRFIDRTASLVASNWKQTGRLPKLLVMYDGGTIIEPIADLADFDLFEADALNSELKQRLNSITRPARSVTVLEAMLAVARSFSNPLSDMVIVASELGPARSKVSGMRLFLPPRDIWFVLTVYVTAER